jgi:hypothetical protein
LATTSSEILKKFEEAAKLHGFNAYGGQVLTNRLYIHGNIYFEFGDLRVETTSHHVIVEVETAGGISNLVKYWYYLEEKEIKKPIILLHIYCRSSKSDYGSHLILWDFIQNKMAKTVGDKVQATCYSYFTSADLSRALHDFEGHLKK